MIILPFIRKHNREVHVQSNWVSAVTMVWHQTVGFPLKVFPSLL